MGLSSRSLFHYTDSLETLQKIISGGFSPSYCKEEIMAVPMVSFCDVPLTSAAAHMTYGDYAIGMSKHWVHENGLSPVIYYKLNSNHDDHLSDGLNSILEIENNLKKLKVNGTLDILLKTKNLARSVTDVIIDVYRYRKPYEDTLNRDGEVIEDYKFYNEREWRFIPKVGSDGIEDYILHEYYEEYKESNPTKPHLPQIKLTMKAEDIDYIIVKNSDDVLPLIDFLEDTGNLGSSKQIKLLTTRIVTKEQIESDF